MSNPRHHAPCNGDILEDPSNRCSTAEGAAPTALLRTMLRSVVRGIQEWRQTRRAERELLAMDDRHLADIGISRSDIASAVRHKHREVASVYPEDS